MKAFKTLTLLLSVSMLLLVAGSAMAQGVIVPGPCERCPRPRATNSAATLVAD